LKTEEAMNLLHYIRIWCTRFIIVIILFQSCTTTEKKKLPENFNYTFFKDSIKAREIKDTSGYTQNVFDTTLYYPAQDTSYMLLKQFDSIWRKDIATKEQIDTLLKLWKKTEKYTPEEIEVIKGNLAMLDSFFSKEYTTEHTGCRENDCLIYAEINKTKQILYLHLDGELIDSFPVSTGIRSRETPSMSLRARGPLLKKYTSKKFPGGNYNGLGNMPYAVFIRGGYAIHGTTRGNFKKLGSRASHGCIRLHPVNAKIFFELVKRIGIDYTWVTIKD
jgi:L,D-transpeptidase catalytic domain